MAEDISTIELTEENLKSLPIKTLKQILEQKGISSAGCVEKGDLIQKILQNKHVQKQPAHTAHKGLLIVPGLPR